MGWFKWKYLIGVAVFAALMTLFFMPRPVEADVATAEIGSLRLTVEEDGRTRVRERYQVAAPLNGKLLRVDWRAGDQVEAGESVLATIVPVSPTLLDARAKAEARARAESARANLEKARAELCRAREARDFAQSEARRIERLWESKQVSQDTQDRAQTTAKQRQAEYTAASKAVNVAQFELKQAEAALLVVNAEPENASGEAFLITAPISGKVFRVDRESEGFISAGTPIMEIADPGDLEIIVDLLSKDAVQVTEGDPVEMLHWGGDQALNGRVRLVEPSGFTKISALGVEEQRVNTIIDFSDPPETWSRLGDGYRVETHIIIWEGSDLLIAPASALIWQRGEWVVFRVEKNKASLTQVTVGRRNGIEAEILEGLSAGDQVILHPSDSIEDGKLIKPRVVDLNASQP